MKNLLALTVGSFAVVAVAACSDSASTTPAIQNDSATGTPTDSGTSGKDDSGVAAPEFTHVAYCLTTLGGGPETDYLKAHRFAVKATQGGTTAAPTISFALTALKTGKNAAERGDPTLHAVNLTTAGTIGAVIPVSNVTLGSDGSFTFTAPTDSSGDIAIPGGGNPLSGTDVSLGSLVLKGKVEDKVRFYGGFTAKITKAAAGVGTPVTAKCIFDKMDMGAQLRAPLKDEYTANN